MSKGIDYGMGATNIDNATGIRYGVIHQNEVCQAWCDSSEADYGKPHCPKCGNEADDIDADGVPDATIPSADDNDQWEFEGNGHACIACQWTFDDALGMP